MRDLLTHEDTLIDSLTLAGQPQLSTLLTKLNAGGEQSSWPNPRAINARLDGEQTR